MRLPKCRVRTVMVLVSVVALLVYGMLLRRRRTEFPDKAEFWKSAKESALSNGASALRTLASREKNYEQWINTERARLERVKVRVGESSEEFRYQQRLSEQSRQHAKSGVEILARYPVRYSRRTAQSKRLRQK